MPGQETKAALLSVLVDSLKPRCLACQRDVAKLTALCDRCTKQVTRPPNHCLFCHEALDDDSPCGMCSEKDNPISRCLAAFAYREPLPSLISLWKFQNRPELTNLLATMVVETLRPALVSADIVIPMPSHWRRQCWRGFDHIWLLSNALCIKANCSLPQPLLKQRHWRPQQSLLEREARRLDDNLFYVTRKLTDKKVALVDDIITTGTTAIAAAKRLKEMGASKVSVLTITRA